MQGKKLPPGQQNVGLPRLRARPPDRRRGDGALDAADQVGKALPGELGGDLGTLDLLLVAEFMAGAMGEDVDQGGLELLGLGVAELGLG